ncbi:MAG: MFS transporter [Thermogemmata sp.]|uniref:MFS transporter n=1 Tax=Thermogemmata fonticola TaxID=2755323 RepID=A0A7V8VC17_9BACT|nr:MFS transporter [Thermogemmata fonticola]MBA2225275.1 MFS transporter [Thermogemmata fonticola]
MRRWLVVGITAAAAFWLYIDRVCFSTLADPIRTDLGLSDSERNTALGMFFLTYALFQVPVGMLADRYGARRVLTLAFLAWSTVTFATGLVQGLAGLLAMRLLLGVSEAGAYPAAAGLIKAWARPHERGRFSSLVALGGRIGGAIAPWLTVATAALLAGYTWSMWDNPSGVPWRNVFFAYGLCGILVALIFWGLVRDQPPDSPTRPESSSSAHRGAYLPTLCRQFALCFRSANMVLFSLMQFGVNLGWGFLITLMPSYLNEQFDVPLQERGQMQSTALFIGCCGMFFGGWVTDGCRYAFGVRWGRRVPLIIALAGCALALGIVPLLTSPWAVVLVLGVMAFLVDLHNPVLWAFAQDVGGKNVGAALGFGNMWGNLGAALSPVLLGAIREAFDWNAAFMVGAVAFLAATASAACLDATRPVEADPPQR